MDDAVVWYWSFNTVVGWQYHPGRKCPLSVPECAEVADAMLREFKLWQLRQHSERLPPGP